MKDIFKLVLSLGLICAIGSSALVWVHNTTEKPIEEANKRALTESFLLVLPAGTASTEPINGQDSLYKALDANGNTIAYAGVGIGPKGFGGDVKVIAGISLEGKIIGVMVTEHSETPGVGTKVTDRKAAKSLWATLAGKAKSDAFPPNEYLDAFADRQAGEFKFGKGEGEIHAISGATYSSKAVLAGVNAICESFNKFKASGLDK